MAGELERRVSVCVIEKQMRKQIPGYIIVFKKTAYEKHDWYKFALHHVLKWILIHQAGFDNISFFRQTMKWLGCHGR